MEFEFTAEQVKFQQELREFVTEEVSEDLLQEIEERRTWLGQGIGIGPEGKKFLRRLGDKGWLGVSWPTEYGGQGRSLMYQYILIEELVSWGLAYGGFTITSVGPTLMRVASEETKKEYLPKILKGEIEFAIGYSEPEAGTDLASLQTRAVKDGDDYVINGQKTFTTHMHHADYVWLAVRTDPSAPKHRGISIIIVPTNAPGITVRPMLTMGDTRTNEVFYDNVRVPRSNLVGEENKGWHYLAAALDYERLAIGTVGRARRIFGELVCYVRETEVNGKPLQDDPVVRHQLADLAVDIEVARLFAWQNAWMIDQGMIPNKEASIAKVWLSELEQRLSSVALDIMGPYGQLRTGCRWAPLKGRIEVLYRAAPLRCFAGGTNEIQRDIIARRGLGLPRA